MGSENWANEKALVEVRKFVYDGGGFIGVGEPTALQRQGKLFQLSDVLGVDKECGISLGEDKKSYCENPLTEAHFYGDRYAIINNTTKKQTTVFYDMDSKAKRSSLEQTKFYGNERN